MISRSAFLDLADASRVTESFTNAQWDHLKGLVSTNERVRRFVEWEVHGRDVVFHGLLTRAAMTDGAQPVALPLEDRERLATWSHDQRLDLAFVDGRTNTYAVQASCIAESVPSNLFAILEGGIINAPAITKDEWITNGLEAANQHIITFDVSYDAFAHRFAQRVMTPAVEHAIAAP